MSKSLPLRPSMEHLKSQARDLLRAARSGDPSAVSRMRDRFPDATEFRLAQAQSAIAREYGFASWRRLKAHVEIVASPDSRREVADRAAVSLLQDPVPAEIWEWLAENPDAATESPALALTLGRADLVSGIDPNAKIGPLDRFPLIYVTFSAAIRQPPFAARLIETARGLLERGADPNAAYPWEGDPTNPLSALYGASGYRRHLRMTRLLLEFGANPNDGESLYHANEGDDVEIVLALMEHGARIDHHNVLARLLDFEKPDWLRMELSYLDSPTEIPPVIPWALRRGRSDEVLDILIYSGMDLSSRAPNGLTPMQAAARYGRAHVIERLRSAGSPDDATELDYAIGRLVQGDASVRIDRWAAELDAEPSNLLALWAEQGRLEAVRAGLAAGLHPDGADENGASGLQFACIRGDLPMAKAFLDAGADPSRRDTVHNGDAIGWTSFGSFHFRTHPDEDYAAIIRAILSTGMKPQQRYTGSAAVEAVLAEFGLLASAD